MNRIWIFSLVSIILASSAAFLCYNKIEGWGWFLFGSLVTFVYPSASGRSEDDEEED